MKDIIFILLISWFVLFLYNCSSGPCNCDRDMERIRSEYGMPSEIKTSIDNGTYSQDWWYNYKGLKFNFKWGSGIDNCCEISISTFPPIQ